VIQAILKISEVERLYVRSASLLSTDTWYHIVLVVDRDSSAETKIYVNGAVDTAGIPVVNTIDYSLGTGACIGRWSGGGEYFGGTIDDFRFLGWALDEHEIIDLYDYGFMQGDINKNDSVNAVDFSILASGWDRIDCSSPNWCDGADINKDGDIDVTDLLVLIEDWLKKLE